MDKRFSDFAKIVFFGIPIPVDPTGSVCGSATLADGSQVVIIGGGFNSGEYQSGVVMFDVGTNQWTEGPELPYPLVSANSYLTESSFLILGGYTFSEMSGYVGYFTILELDPINIDWKIREERLSRPNYDFWVVDVDENVFC